MLNTKRNKHNPIKSVSIFLATREDVLGQSKGEVTLPETVNYKSYKPETGGLFDEVIFGPTADYTCPVCGKKYQRSNEGQKCLNSDKCKVLEPEILPKSAKRSRMGHISLASPVVHYWFLKIDHSILSRLLSLSIDGSKVKRARKKEIDDIVYFKSHIVLESGGLKTLPQNEVIDINSAPVTYRKALRELQERFAPDSSEYKEIDEAVKELEEEATSKLGADYGIDFYELNETLEYYSEKSGKGTVKIDTGAKAIEYILERLDLKKEANKVRRQIKKLSEEIQTIPVEKLGSSSKPKEREKLYKRLNIINPLIKSKQDPKNFLIYDLPVIPADLRPLIQVDGGRLSTSDINELYRRVIIRNNRLKKWINLDAPRLIVQNELRMLQEAVDALIDNGRKANKVMSKDNRPLKSISESLVGKKGRFRQNLLGKRVDYSGRSVIVVGPNLKMHQAGIPRQMAAKLFEPWIIREIIEGGLAGSIKAAKKMIEEFNNEIWPLVEKVIKDKIVLLNRAPSLHRLSVQAFEPVLVRGKAIQLHPLVTTAFNADFDGDQMAVHVPVSPEAIREAREIMLANKNILGPKDGEPIVNPSQDMILGTYYLTKEEVGAKGEGTVVSSLDTLRKSYENGHLTLHTRVIIPTYAFPNREIQSWNGYIITTVGKVFFNNSFPKNFPYIFDGEKSVLNGGDKRYFVPKGKNPLEVLKALPAAAPLGKGNVAKVIRRIFDKYNPVVSKEDISTVIADVNVGNYTETLAKYSELKVKDENILIHHAELLEQFTRDEFEILNRKITAANEGIERSLEVSEKVELLEKVWFRYTNVIASSLDSVKELGFKYSTRSGITISISDVDQVTSDIRELKTKSVSEGEEFDNKLRQLYKIGGITDKERYSLLMEKWTEIKNDIEGELKDVVGRYPDNPIITMMNSGARGNLSNFTQLAAIRGIMRNGVIEKRAWRASGKLVKLAVEVPVKSSLQEGIDQYGFYSSAPGVRKGLIDTAKGTGRAGYVTRKLVDLASDIVIKERDCKTSRAFVMKNIIDTRRNSIITPLEERIIGRYTSYIPVKSGNKVIIPTDTMITQEHVEAVKAAGIDQVTIRSVLGCNTKNGTCVKCYGTDLSTNREVQIGEPVGIVAAQSIGEPGTQLSMRTFHTGGAGSTKGFTDNFDRLNQIIDIYNYENAVWNDSERAVISHIWGKIQTIEKTDTKVIVSIKASYGEEVVIDFKNYKSRVLRVKEGDTVEPGDKIAEGVIDPRQLLEFAGVIKTQSYLIKELQRVFRSAGINVSDKYFEIVVKRMLSKILVTDKGTSTFSIGSLIDDYRFIAEFGKSFEKGVEPAIGTITIFGARDLTTKNNQSFLAAASFIKTPEMLVYASISGQMDVLQGMKENIIVGHAIPAGTGSAYEAKSKFDVRDPYTFFM